MAWSSEITPAYFFPTNKIGETERSEHMSKSIFVEVFVVMYHSEKSKTFRFHSVNKKMLYSDHVLRFDLNVVVIMSESCGHNSMPNFLNQR